MCPEWTSMYQRLTAMRACWCGKKSLGYATYQMRLPSEGRGHKFESCRARHVFSHSRNWPVRRMSAEYVREAFATHNASLVLGLRLRGYNWLAD
jgi:hypothetical protein